MTQENTSPESTVDAEAPVVQQDELATLKERATKLGLTFHPSIGLEKLREKVLEAMNPAPKDEAAAPAPAPVAPAAVAVAKDVPKEETVGQKRMRLKRAATALVRVRVSCMNPAKKEWEGEIFTVGNSAIGSVKKYVPFNSEEGWHIPQIMLDMIKERHCQIFITKTDERGRKSRVGKLIREFAVEVLEPLDTEELQELAQRQAMSKSVG